jgi:hypothetical protein
MDQTKEWYKSLTMLGAAIIAILGVVLPMFGRGDLAGKVAANQTDILNAISQAGTLIGLCFTIVGRMKANTTLTGGQKK